MGLRYGAIAVRFRTIRPFHTFRTAQATTMATDRCARLSGPRCPAVQSMSPRPPQSLRRSWESPDPLLRRLGVRYLQIGGDVWNRCNEGWLNIDGAFAMEGLRPFQYGTDDKGAHNLMLAVSSSTQLPFRSNSVQLIFTEHMFEHILPHVGAVLLREAYRVLVPGGVLRLATPDLALYLCGWVKPSGKFLSRHARRFAPMESSADREARQVVDLGRPSDATVVNNIFRNYGHQWIYDFDEFVRVAEAVGIRADQVCRTDRHGTGLPTPLSRAIRRAVHPRNSSLACWLDQEVREDESLYVHVIKGPTPSKEHNISRHPFCAPLKGDWFPCRLT